MTFFKQHSSIEISFGRNKPVLNICGLTADNIPYPALFKNLTKDCKPMAMKSRRHSLDDKQFIGSEIKRMLQDEKL